ncbi:MAG: putative DNA binding domain-containing protein, partial [Anaerolineae bacterium]|nr:putative DNA binding domain-containing protein [Caldilineales bacterium]MDW8270206.1 putative DNA binding domain-containing protein [Anaerolineae bacterium]
MPRQMVSELLTSEDLRAALDAGPGERLALLGPRATARQIAETAVAMANAHGGLIVLGATAEGISGLDAPEQARSLILEALAMPDPPLIVPLPLILTLDGRTLCVLQIPPGLPHVYNLKGQYLTRSDRHNRPLLADELRRLLINRSEVSYESYVPEGATMADLDEERVAAYQARMATLAYPTATALLLSRGCAVMTPDGPRPTVAGLLLFGRDPQRWVRSATLTCVRYAGETMSDAFVREDIAGVLPDQIRRGEAFVAANMRRGARIRGLAREEVPEYPISVVREAIVNAVAHRDYSIRGDDI